MISPCSGVYIGAISCNMVRALVAPCEPDQRRPNALLEGGFSLSAELPVVRMTLSSLSAHASPEVTRVDAKDFPCLSRIVRKGINGAEQQADNPRIIEIEGLDLFIGGGGASYCCGCHVSMR